MTTKADDKDDMASQSGQATSDPTPEPSSSQDPTDNSTCKASRSGCTTGSTHLRKVISQFFGRNKRETRAIPEEFWVKWCRKHYQRHRYRRDVWVKLQLGLINDMIDQLEDYGKVRGWTVTIRKTEEKKLRDPKFAGERIREEALIKWVGKGKSFEYVRGFVNEVVAKECCAEGARKEELPHFQLLPDIDTYPVRVLSKAGSEESGCDGEEEDDGLMLSQNDEAGSSKAQASDVKMSEAEEAEEAEKDNTSSRASSQSAQTLTKSATLSRKQKELAKRQQAFRKIIQTSSSRDDVDPYRTTITTTTTTAGFTAISSRNDSFYKSAPVTPAANGGGGGGSNTYAQQQRNPGNLRRQKKVAARKKQRADSI